MDAIEFGERIQRRRKELSLTQKELANQLGVSDRAVSKWETGKGFPDISLMDALAKALNIEVADLFIDDAMQTKTEDTSMKSIVNDTLEYAKGMQLNYSDRLRNLIMIVFSALCLIGITTVLIVDFVLFKTLTWSLVACASIAFAYLVTLPIIIKGLKGIKWSLVIISIAIIPFIYSITLSLSLPGYVISIGWKVALFGIGYLWLAYVLFKSKKFEYYTVVSILILIAAPFNYIMQRLLFIETGIETLDIMQYLSFIINTIVAISIYVYFSNRKKRIKQ